MTAGSRRVPVSKPPRCEIDLPSCIRSKASFDLVERHGVGDQVVDVDLPSMYQSTILGTSVRPRAPPKAVPRQTGR